MSEGARTLFLARHGETDWNAEGRWQGHTDVPLNATGREQARALGERMRREGIAAIASSDLARARVTAEIVAGVLGIQAIHVDPDLREQRYGSFEGLTRKESEASFPAEWARYAADWRTTPPRGEPYPALVERVLAATRRIAERLAPPALVIMHGGAIRALLGDRLGAIPSPASTGWARHGIPNGGIFRLTFSAGCIVEALRLEPGPGAARQDARAGERIHARPMPSDDREKWNARYREQGAPKAPSSFLTGLDALLPRRGRALDVAGGSGRHALWLARRGLAVTLADVSEVALEQASRAAREEGLPLATVRVDLEAEPLPEGPWDLIVCTYFLHRPLFAAFAAALAPGGWLAFAHATRRNLERHPRPGPGHVLEEGELATLVQGLRIVQIGEGWFEEGRHEARLVARKLEERAGP